MVGWYRQGHRPEQEDQRVLHYWRSQVFWGCADHPNAEKANICFSRDIKRGGQLASPSLILMPWWAILVATLQRMGKDHLTVLAAGAAFQALFSLFPMPTAAVSLYGFVADPSTVERQITAMQGVLPPEAVKLIATWLQTLVQGTTTKFGIGLIVSVLLALWSMWSATGMLMTAVNICYGAEEKRDLVSFNLHALALGVILALAIVYRYAPDRAEPRWQWISWGSVSATALWILGSIAFTTYVSKVGSYDKTYGSLGAVIILLLWFYLTAYVILAGAELNAEIERQTARAKRDPARACSLDPQRQ